MATPKKPTTPKAQSTPPAKDGADKGKPTSPTADPTPEEEKDLAKENAALKEQLAAAESKAKAAEGRLAREALSPADLKLIDTKVKAGLDRSQAEAVVKAQKAHDAKLEEAEEDAAE